ncbi:chromosome partitioning protein ParB [Candidatus Saccharibacteria bacterium 49-20]|nr:MAG: chromosome partitioning protein ParB [Candidatus Saccharibacteria bacterium 49-20]
MSAAKKGLGRGFESLIPTDLIDDSFNPNSAYDPTAQQDERVSKEATLPLDKLQANPDQPRQTFDKDALEELAASINEHGIIQPIVVTPKGEGYEIVAGERRYRASKLAGLTEVPVIVRSMSDQTQLEISLIENIQRRDLNSIETATAYAKLRDQFNLTNDEIAKRVQKSSSAVINTMRLLKLPAEVIALIAEGQLSEGQARPLIGQDKDFIVSLVPRIVTEEWSVRKVEQYLVDLKNGNKEVTKNTEVVSEYEPTLEHLRSRLGTGVNIRVNSKGAGKLTIDFKNQEEFDRIKALLG